MKILRFTAISILIFAALACGETNPEQPEAEAPVLLSTDPANGTSEVRGSSLTVTFNFDQNIRCSPSDQAAITIDGGASVDGVSVAGASLIVSLSGLNVEVSYVMTLPEGTVHGLKTNQKSSPAITFTFSTKDVTPDQWDRAGVAARKMGTGWNLGNTLESNSGDTQHMWIEAWTDAGTSDYETAWGQPVATRELIHMFKEAGFNSIRVPVTWYPHMGRLGVEVKNINGEYTPVWDVSAWTGYDVDPVWMARVKEVVDYVIDEGMYCILNVHHDTGDASTAWLRADQKAYEQYRERYVRLWQQIGTEFADYGQKLLFESFNEMLDAKGTWNYSTQEAHEVINKWNADFVSTVRATGGNNAFRNLILNTYAASSDPKAWADFRLPQDSTVDHLMVEVHSYAPYSFAMYEGSTKKTVFDAACEREVTGIVENLNKYFVSKGIPCVIGEYGCTSTREETERAKQAACYVSNAAKYDIPCFYWMSLSDGEDRAALKWTCPSLKNAILNAYNDNRNN